MKLLSILALTLLIGKSMNAQVSTCDGTRYASFGFVPAATTGIQFGNATTYGGNNQDLFMDIYEPSGDVASERPLVIVAFGGSFIQGTRQDMDWMCQYYAALGYVAATIDYRLYDGPLFPLPDSVAMTEEVLMAVSDMKASIRFFKEDAANANTYRIDTNHIFVGGISAGGIVASHAALLDSNDIIEPYIQPLLANNGGWTGNSSTNTHHTDNVRGVINYSGALRKASYIDANDPDIFSVHDDGDQTVPYAAGAASVAGFPIINMEGSFLMDQQAQNVGVPTQLITFPGNGHVSYFQGSQAVADSVLWQSASFLYNIICPQYAGINEGDVEATLNIFPNPTVDEFTVTWEGEVSSVALIDALGQTVVTRTPTSNEVIFNVSNLDSGVYFLKIISDRGTITEPIQKI